MMPVSEPLPGLGVLPQPLDPEYIQVGILYLADRVVGVFAVRARNGNVPQHVDRVALAQLEIAAQKRHVIPLDIN